MQWPQAWVVHEYKDQGLKGRPNSSQRFVTAFQALAYFLQVTQACFRLRLTPTWAEMWRTCGAG